jgi:hypothetical protein
MPIVWSCKFRIVIAQRLAQLGAHFTLHAGYLANQPQLQLHGRNIHIPGTLSQQRQVKSETVVGMASICCCPSRHTTTALSVMTATPNSRVYSSSCQISWRVSLRVGMGKLLVQQSAEAKGIALQCRVSEFAELPETDALEVIIGE